jgi:hypothetical protein
MTTIQVYEQSSAYDDYDTENGLGHAEDVEPELVETVECDNSHTAICDALADLGLTEWDGRSVAYDPDGSDMAFDGTITTRYAVILFDPSNVLEGI